MHEIRRRNALLATILLTMSLVTVLWAGGFVLRTHDPYYGLGSWLWILAPLLLVWSFSLFPEQYAPRSKVAPLLRVFRWLIVAPSLVLVASFTSYEAIYGYYLGKRIGVLGMAEVTPTLMTLLFKALLAQIFAYALLIVLPLAVFITASLLAYSYRVHKKVTGAVGGTKRSKHRFIETISDLIDSPLSRRLALVLLPDTPQIGVFVRFSLASLVIAVTYAGSPVTFSIEFARQVFPLIVSLPERGEFAGFADPLLPCFMSSFALFAYSLKWKPAARIVFFRIIALFYSLLFVASLVVLMERTLTVSQYLAWIIAGLIVAMPFTFACAYGTWALESVLRKVFS